MTDRPAAQAGSRRIITLGRNAWRQVRPDDAGLLIDAADYYYTFYHAARAARRYILMSGWQFDSGVKLLRGADLPDRRTEVRLLKLLNRLCKEKPDLEIFIIAWDFHVVFAAEREWLQRVLFHWLTHTHLRFVFLDCPVSGGSHHQKYVVIDGVQSFLGGIDVCEARWDDRAHCEINSLRLSRGRAQKPYHDVQAYLAGSDPAAALTELFRAQWKLASGEALQLPPAPTAPAPAERPRGLLPIGAQPTALSRTVPGADGDTVREVEHLFTDAIAAAERLIYIETQYFSSRRIFEALVLRMREAARPRLQIVIVVNERAEAVKEEIAVGLRQAKNLEGLRCAAAETGHGLGLYYTACAGDHEKFRTTYVHSKLLLVDDRFLTVGSANMTNRSMGIDTELQAAWETGGDGPADPALCRAIRRARVSLLAEHGGLSGLARVRQLVPIDGLVDRLDALAESDTRLKRHGPPSPAQEAVMEVVDPQNLPFDPDTSEDPHLIDEPCDESRLRRWRRR